MPVYVLAVLSTNSRGNFTAAEVATMAMVAKRIIAALRRR
jgi:hypothetical protein